MHDHDANKVQLPDYALVECPTISNHDMIYSRVVAYIHKSVVYKLRNDQMSKEYSSVWAKISLPGQKQILVSYLQRVA